MKTTTRTQTAADFAWAGQHEQAIAAATAALKRKTIDADERMTLLDLRSESYIAQGDLKRAGDDAKAMKALARQEGGAALQARALCRESFVQARDGRARRGTQTGAAAIKAAERSGVPELIAQALWRHAMAASSAGFCGAGGRFGASSCTSNVASVSKSCDW